MMKKIIFLSTIFGLSATAYAADPGWYIGVQPGYSNTNYRSNIIPFGPIPDNVMSQSSVLQSTFVNTFTLFANAVKANNSTVTSVLTSTPSSTSQDTGFGIRGLVGYQFNDYFALEGGYTHFANSQSNLFDTSSLTFYNSIGVPSTVATSSVTEKNHITEQAIDLSGKLIYPFSDSGFDVYAKLGIADLRANQNFNFNTTAVIPNSIPANFNPANFTTSTASIVLNHSLTTRPVRPLYGIGMSYDFNPNWVMDLGWTRIQGTSFVQSADLYDLGLAYHFC